jgi:hypothetical protein
VKRLRILSHQSTKDTIISWNNLFTFSTAHDFDLQLQTFLNMNISQVMFKVRVKEVENFNSSRDERLTTHFSITTTNIEMKNRKSTKTFFNAVGHRKFTLNWVELDMCKNEREKKIDSQVNSNWFFNGFSFSS